MQPYNNKKNLRGWKIKTVNENNLAIIEDNKVIIKPDGISLFSDQVEYWVDFLGLSDWSLIIVVSDKGDEDTPVACINTNNQGRCATITIYDKWYSDVYNLDLVEQQLKQSAFHEACHLMLADLRDLANSREFIYTEYYKLEEIVVRKMENSFYRELNKRQEKPERLGYE